MRGEELIWRSGGHNTHLWAACRAAPPSGTQASAGPATPATTVCPRDARPATARQHRFGAGGTSCRSGGAPSRLLFWWVPAAGQHVTGHSTTDDDVAHVGHVVGRAAEQADTGIAAIGCHLYVTVESCVGNTRHGPECSEMLVQIVRRATPADKGSAHRGGFV